MKKILLLLALILPMFFTSCVSKPTIESTLPAKDYEILGRVSVDSIRVNLVFIGYESESLARLYKEAKDIYPDCDEIINVYTDIHGFQFFYLLGFQSITRSGLAIKYK